MLARHVELVVVCKSFELPKALRLQRGMLLPKKTYKLELYILHTFQSVANMGRWNSTELPQQLHRTMRRFVCSADLHHETTHADRN